MARAEATSRGNLEIGMNIDDMRFLVKQYSELGQWTSALFWADAAAAAASGNGPDSASGDDVWLLASAMLARGELHRAAHAVTSRGLHRRHLLCLCVAMRSYLLAKEPTVALNLMDECDPMLLDPRTTDQRHNRALAGVLVWQARALSSLERREAAAEALSSALRADCACYEALDLLLEQHALTPRQERELIESLPINSQLGAAEGALLRAAYRERLNRYAPAPAVPPPPDVDDPITTEAEEVYSRTAEAAACRGRRLTAACRWKEALAALDSADPWCCVEVRTACLVELKRSADLFAFAHTLVDAYPNAWTSWFAVGCYYYVIGKSEFARRYLSKAKSLEPGAGCVWLAYAHSFAQEKEHDQAMAAYFKASQVMAGCHLPPMYVAVECSLLNNTAMCEKFLARAAELHNDNEGAGEQPAEESEAENVDGWAVLVGAVGEAHLAHEAGVAAFAGGDADAAKALFLKALDAANAQHGGVFAVINGDSELGMKLSPRWAATLDALGHACRVSGQPLEGLQWHERALALRPGRPQTYAAIGLCLALLSREAEAAHFLHTALAKDPDDVVSLALLDAIMDKVDAALTDEEIPQFAFPAVDIPIPTPPTPRTPTAGGGDLTNISDMSMSFD
ncbi:hypothetical protein K1T71_006511 [Dendrolimus kikuchii]|uniref:Uncharacterized protein n=1 Tax=Dendrolimus kikuchii TaxID=765133 RepID=A0ACC1D133_9NEOP|nr:hypothetical protein K1T71_006511 [Dendrolimus kikuchii]